MVSTTPKCRDKNTNKKTTSSNSDAPQEKRTRAPQRCQKCPNAPLRASLDCIHSRAWRIANPKQVAQPATEVVQGGSPQATHDTNASDAQRSTNGSTVPTGSLENASSPSSMSLFGLPAPLTGAPQTPTHSVPTSIGTLRSGNFRLPDSNPRQDSEPGHSDHETFFSPQDSGSNRNPITNIFTGIGSTNNSDMSNIDPSLFSSTTGSRASPSSTSSLFILGSPPCSPTPPGHMGIGLPHDRIPSLFATSGTSGTEEINSMSHSSLSPSGSSWSSPSLASHTSSRSKRTRITHNNPIYGYVDGAARGSHEFKIPRPRGLPAARATTDKQGHRYRLLIQDIIARCERLGAESNCWLYLGAQHPGARTPFTHFSTERLRLEGPEVLDELHTCAERLFNSLLSARRQQAAELSDQLHLAQTQLEIQRAEIEALRDTLQRRSNVAEGSDKDEIEA